MSQPTILPAQIVAGTIVRTVELGWRSPDAALAEDTTMVFADLLVDGPGACRGFGLAGFRNLINYRVRCLLHCGALAL